MAADISFDDLIPSKQQDETTSLEGVDVSFDDLIPNKPVAKQSFLENFLDDYSKRREITRKANATRELQNEDLRGNEIMKEEEEDIVKQLQDSGLRGNEMMKKQEENIAIEKEKQIKKLEQTTNGTKVDNKPLRKIPNEVTGRLIPFDSKSAVLNTPEGYRTYAMQEAKKMKLDPNLADNIFKIESEYNPKAVSGTGSTGIAQFTKATGRYYGLTINDKVDERFNPSKSITAALKFMADLNKKYKGNPELIALAYNQGEPVLDEHLRKNNGKIVTENLRQEIAVKLKNQGKLSDKEIEQRSNEPINYLNKLRKMSNRKEFSTTKN